MVAVLYQLVLWLALPGVWLRLKWRARKEPEYGQRIAERFGQVPDSVPTNCVWFHTVSAGETIAAAGLIRSLCEEFPDYPFLVTTMTPTGSDQVRARLSDCVAHCYAPYDFKFAVHRFFERVQPKLLVLMETELWPNLIAVAGQHNVPVVVINARLSARSAAGYARLKGLTQPMLTRLDAIACQTETHVGRFVELGADPVTTTAMGSVKYDVALPQRFEESVAALERAFALSGGPVWIAASTHRGEDDIVLQALLQARQRNPELRLLLVPRHPVRADEVSTLVVEAGLTVSRQSELTHENKAPAEATEVIIGDVMGSLLILYGLADVAFVGGSLVDVGGHNPLEPALCRLPILCGPHQFNFSEAMAELEDSGALLTINDADTLAGGLMHWLGDPQARRRAGEAASEVLAAHRGATDRLQKLLGGRIRTVFLQ